MVVILPLKAYTAIFHRTWATRLTKDAQWRMKIYFHGTHIFEFDGVKVFLSPKDAEKLKDSTIDWTETLMESGFNIENPQAKRPCGCGESFDLS